jgi:hypothetical protein
VSHRAVGIVQPPFGRQGTRPLTASLFGCCPALPSAGSTGTPVDFTSSSRFDTLIHMNDETRKYFDGKLARLASLADLKQLATDIENLAGITQRGFTAVDVRFDSLDRLVEEIDDRLIRMENIQVKHLTTRVALLEEQVQHLIEGE